MLELLNGYKTLGASDDVIQAEIYLPHVRRLHAWLRHQGANTYDYVAETKAHNEVVSFFALFFNVPWRINVLVNIGADKISAPEL